MASAAELLQLAETDVKEAIPKEQYGPVLMSPPFIYVDGTFNTRDLGLVPGSPLRANFAIRSGALGHLTDNGKAVLTGKLGVRRVFDLRSPEERARMPDPALELDDGGGSGVGGGVEATWIESLRPDSTPDLARFARGRGEDGYRDMYLEVLDVYRRSWRAVLEHVRDRPGDPFLVHCTAGRDRTGVLSGLLLKLAGASDDVVVLDWMLSRVGTEPVREMLLKFAMEGSNAAGQEAPGFYNLCSLRRGCWEAFARGVERDYGGFEKFVTDELAFSHEDLAKIRKHLTTSE
ncbi:protein-tyrosine phosphatase-like protein [Xylariaceae sp. FL0804]|nr:protein-tyrosine phosphatase-like protein [Xylariaceae sp. FL0804]